MNGAERNGSDSSSDYRNAAKEDRERLQWDGKASPFYIYKRETIFYDQGKNR